jgi:hypothetical protein
MDWVSSSLLDFTVEGMYAGKERRDAPPPANPFAEAEREAKAEKNDEMR